VSFSFIFVATFALISVLWIFLYLSNRLRASKGTYKGKNVDLTGKVAIITGGNGGIGFETAKDLAKRNAQVILACRDPSSTQKAVEQLIKETGNNKIFYRHLDLSSLKSVQKFTQEFLATKSPCHILICNAGKGFCPRSLTEDGYESIFATNHLGHFLLVNLLLDNLNQNSARIVMVSSGLHKRSGIDFEDLMFEKKPWDGRKVYATSKLANVLFAYELQRRLNDIKGPKATVNAVHPGIVATNLGRDSSARARFIFKYGVVPLLGRTVYEGAQTSIYCAIAPELEGIGGKYFGDCKEEKSSDDSYNEEVARKLWEISERLTNLKH